MAKRALSNYDKHLRYNVDQNFQLSAKRSMWKKDAEQGYVRVTVIKGDQSMKEWNVEMPDGAKVTVPRKQLVFANPAKFDGVKDCSSLSRLNDATVFHNLRVRYSADLIHTYSGLFLVVINPYKWIPIYTPEMIEIYRGKRRTEVHPHVFALADEAYRAMIQNKKDQSMLITGESGAGKTENTKKVIQYLATIAGKASEGGKLEQQILQANPMMEAFGNAKTNKNDNSSRFGKFIRIQFNTGGIICGTTIQVYLLEKSRVVHQGPNERTFHIFYQLLVGATAEQKKLLHLLPARNIKFFTDKNAIKCKSLDDVKEFKDMVAAMEVIGISEEERESIFRIISGIQWCGNLAYETGYGSEGANIANTDCLDVIAELWELNKEDFAKALTKPRIRAGTEIVQKHLNKSQAEYSRDALCKAIYERLFMWLVKKLNRTLAADREANFIGVLDIAGFEIFELNSFEQLCINFTNEKLQQFFNHHMFKLEQEEYAREKIEWKFIDFGMDAQETINLIEKKPNSIFSFLDEETIFPRATDKTLINKLHTLAGKSKKYSKVQFKQVNFKILHYAGDVDYDVSGWIDKNKDPLQDDIEKAIQGSNNYFISNVFSDPDLNPREKLAAMKAARSPSPSAGKGRSRGTSRGTSRKGGAAFMTVASHYKNQLDDLMNTLNATEPHFIRCIIPNLQKRPGLLDSDLVLEQLRCNGVLEGIKISRRGFPNRLKYAEFVRRYYLLHPTLRRNEPESKEATKSLMAEVRKNPVVGDPIKKYEEDANKKHAYQFGQTKIFFRHGILAKMEEMREAKLGAMVVAIQAAARGWIGRNAFKKIGAQTNAARVLQKNLKAWLQFREWKWWTMFQAAKQAGLFTRIDYDEIIQKLDRQIEDLSADLKVARGEVSTLEKEYNGLEERLSDAEDQLDAGKLRVGKLSKEHAALQKQVEELEADQEKLEDQIRELNKSKTLLEADIKEKEEDLDAAPKELDDVTAQRKKAEAIRKDNEAELDEQQSKIASLNGEQGRLKEQVSKLEEEVEEASGGLDEQGARARELTKVVAGLEADRDELADKLDAEKSAKSDLERQKKKLDGELKDLKSELADAEAALESAKKSNGNLTADIEGLTADLEALESEIAKLEKQKKELTGTQLDTQADLDDEKANRSSAEKRGKSLHSQVQELNEKVEDLEDRKGDLENTKRKNATNIGGQKTDAERLRSELAKLQKQQAALEGKVKDAEDQLDEVSGEKDTLERGNKKLKGELADAQGDLEDAQSANSALQKQKTKLDRDLKEGQGRLEENETAKNSLTADNNRLQGELADLEVQAEEAEKKAIDLTREASTIDAQLQEARAELEEEQDSRERAEKGRKTAEAALAEAKAELEDLEATQADLEEQLRRKTAEAQEMRNRAAVEGMAAAKAKWREAQAKLNGELDDVRAALAEQESLNRAAERSLKKAASDVEAAEAINDGIEQGRVKAEESRKHAEKKVEDNRKELNVARKDCAVLHKELSIVQQELFALRDILRMAIQVSGEAVLMKPDGAAPLTRASLARREQAREESAESAILRQASFAQRGSAAPAAEEQKAAPVAATGDDSDTEEG